MRKLALMRKFFSHRQKDLKIAKECDTIYIYREAFFLGTTFFEKRFAKLGKKIIFDFDDAIWLNDTSNANKHFSFLKKPKKTAEICKLATTVIVGNKYLADYAKQFNKNVVIIPTTLNTYSNNCLLWTSKIRKSKVCIGWAGSGTTTKHFETAIPVLKKIKEKYGNKIYFKVISNQYFKNEVKFKFTQWKIETENQELLEFDIGIMPLPDDQWSKGKCGFKGLQCMSLGIPVVMSAVGTNCDIINNGKNGFLASTEEQWVEYLSELIDNQELRQRIGENGKQTVEDKYSFDVWKKKYLNLF